MINEVTYTVSFEKPHTHYCEVEIALNDLNQDSVLFSMPVWTPGSYLIREFAKNVEGVLAVNGKGVTLSVEKINKNTWKVVTNGQDKLIFSYKVYCNESSVRTSEINSEHAFLSNAGVFMFVRGLENKECILKIDLPSLWKKISTGLNKVSNNVYSAPNYDVFIDCPVEIGNQNILEFEVKGFPHFICLYGNGNYDPERLISDFKTIAEEEVKLMGGELPLSSYTYIIHLVEKGGGGLEHSNSFVGQMVRWNFKDEKNYRKILGLVSHEYFHLWNVKRIRPAALGPFNYDIENYTKGLWVSEGWTSFYDNMILLRCELVDRKEYFELVDVEVNDIMRFEGRFRQSLSESSYDAWIKHYRQDENSPNSQISYYTKGALVASMLNIEIIKGSDAEKSLDDALRMLFGDYKMDSTRGFTYERVKEICETISGKNLDDFWRKYIDGTDELPLESYFKICGLELTNENDTLKSSLDIQSKTQGESLIIEKVFAGGTAYESGLNAKDEILAIDGIRVNSGNLKEVLKHYSEGDVAKALISRSGFIKEINVKFLKPFPKYKIKEMEDINDEQKMFLEKWLVG